MSTTTTTTTTASTLAVLADYEVHHSGSHQPDQQTETVISSQPADWPTDHRRVPAYRPVQPNLSYTERPAGNGHPAEYAFIQIMLHGVWLNASVARLWRFTGGRMNDKIFHYDVGREW
ncbi:hypothetical protein N7509_001261 [Penicillium cosmopolitanum]|uniref:Uncharacterized protein n=1 Tax=Penicillium cosmopolitanum TaxID=1131564 RepID=A0A9X0BF05_9EURO|nr:uncharacterized protein N7509_001261 [Penicillium cosmopolitanum]KAJ5414634.1 hypothetical protein N7509_001261 [Penicillium cosmopolitanum]